MLAAREALETTAPESISLKSLALGLGVSQPAPYRHFDSREALLTAVATDGFEQFRAELAAAWKGPPEDGFERSCLAYLSFGRTNPGLYRLMFASRLLAATRDEALRKASTASFDLLLEQISRSTAPEHVRATALWVWSTLHGLVMLEAENLASGPEREQGGAAQIVRRMAAVLASHDPLRSIDNAT